MKRVNVQPNERVGIPDFEAGAGGKLMQQDQFREAKSLLIPEGRTTGGASTSARIFGGFEWDPISLGVDTAATLNRGTGIFSVVNDDNEVEFGLIHGDEGEATILVDFSAATLSATSDVYIRPVLSLTEFENRVFWDPTGASELSDNISTRKVVTWEATFRDNGAPPPGEDDWVKIYEVDIDGAGTITAVRDFRHFFFEGDAAATTAFDHEWGDGTNDRNADRTLAGIHDLNRWCSMVKRQLSDIIDDSASTPQHIVAPPRSLKSCDDALTSIVATHWKVFFESMTDDASDWVIDSTNPEFGWLFAGSGSGTGKLYFHLLAREDFILNEAYIKLYNPGPGALVLTANIYLVDLNYAVPATPPSKGAAIGTTTASTPSTTWGRVAFGIGGTPITVTAATRIMVIVDAPIVSNVNVAGIIGNCTPFTI